jgi:hypothetical protein
MAHPARRVHSEAGNAAASDIELDGEVVVDYDPCLDGDPDPGEVVWTWVPWEEDPNQGKDRPVVVFGRRGDHLAAVALTSRPRPSEPQVPVGVGPWDRDGRPSFARLVRVLAVDPAQVRREGAVLSRDRFDALVAALARHHRIRLRRPDDRP